jgi:hypothetical protein
LDGQLRFGDCAIENGAVDFVGFDFFAFECVEAEITGGVYQLGS